MKRFVALWRETYCSPLGKQTKYSERDCVRSTSRSSLAVVRTLKFSPVNRAGERAAAGLSDTAALRFGLRLCRTKYLVVDEINLATRPAHSSRGRACRAIRRGAACVLPERLPGPFA